MTVHVALRETLDWERADYNDMLPFVRDTVRLWDQTFRLEYRTCRARIKAIAQAAHRAAHAHVVPLDGVGDLRADDVVLPCDDDDWFHPRIFDHIRAAHFVQAGLLLWPDGVYGWHNGRWHLDRAAFRPLDAAQAVSGAIKTNNYALTVALARRVPALLRHPTAVKYLREHSPTYQSLSPALSIVCRHPCSITVWRNNLVGLKTDTERSSKLRQIMDRYINGKIGASSCCRWALPELEQVRAVFSEAVS